MASLWHTGRAMTRISSCSGRPSVLRSELATRSFRSSPLRAAPRAPSPPGEDPPQGQQPQTQQPAAAPSPAQLTSTLLSALTQRLEAASPRRRSSGSGSSGAGSLGMSPLSSVDPEEAAAAAAQAARDAYMAGDIGFGFSAGVPRRLLLRWGARGARYARRGAGAAGCDTAAAASHAAKATPHAPHGRLRCCATWQGTVPATPQHRQALLQLAVPASRVLQPARPLKLATPKPSLTCEPAHAAHPTGGLLFPFYCGVVDELAAMGVIREGTKLAGASAGSLIVACARRWAAEPCRCLLRDRACLEQQTRLTVVGRMPSCVA